MRKTTILIGAFLVLAFVGWGCKSDSTSPTSTPSINGEWQGEKEFQSLAKYKLKLNLMELSGVIIGTGELTTEVTGQEKTVIPIPAVDGTYNFPDVQIGFEPYLFKGKMSADGKTITGTIDVPNPLTGSGTIPVEIILVKQISS